MQRLVTAMLLVVAVFHWLPLAGVLGADRLATLYGVAVVDPELLVLLRHRAILFGLLAAYLSVAAFRPAWQPLALAAGAVSVVSFLVLAAALPTVGSALQRVVLADWVALACLAVGTAARWQWSRMRRLPHAG
jgi:hypothetical protein